MKLTLPFHDVFLKLHNGAIKYYEILYYTDYEDYYPHMWNMERSMLELLEIILLRMDLYDQQVFEKKQYRIFDNLSHSWFYYRFENTVLHDNYY